MTTLHLRALVGAALLATAAGAFAQSTIGVKDATGATQNIRVPNADGRAPAASSAPVVLSNEDSATAAAVAAAAGTKTDVGGTATDGTALSQIALLKGEIIELKALILQLPATLGAKTSANSISVAPASDATFASTIADGADLALGAKADAAYTVGSATLIAIAKAIDRDTLLPLAAQSGPVLIGNVGQNGTWTFSGNLAALQQAGSTAKNLIVGGAVADGNAPQTYSEPVAGTDATGLKRTFSTDVTGALTPPQAPSGSITQTITTVSASTSTTLAAALATTIAVEIQCDGTAPVAIDRKGGTLTSLATAPLVLPATAYQLYVMPVATTAAITGWTATAQTCRVTQYARQ